MNVVDKLRAWMTNGFDWKLMLIPVGVIVAVFLVTFHNVMGWSDEDRFKSMMEVVHPAFLVIMAAVSWGKWYRLQQPVFAFVGVLSLFVLSREILGEGSSVILYIGIIGISLYGRKHSEIVNTMFSSRMAASLITATILCYALSQCFDRGTFRWFFRQYYGDPRWMLWGSSNFEEALEATGGFFLMMMAFRLQSQTASQTADRYQAFRDSERTAGGPTTALE
jgi:hypothetical protein